MPINNLCATIFDGSGNVSLTLYRFSKYAWHWSWPLEKTKVGCKYSNRKATCDCICVGNCNVCPIGRCLRANHVWTLNVTNWRVCTASSHNTVQLCRNGVKILRLVLYETRHCNKHITGSRVDIASSFLESDDFFSIWRYICLCDCLNFQRKYSFADGHILIITQCTEQYLG